MDNSEVLDLARMLGCSVGVWLMKYLGLPIGCNMLLKSWNTVVERFKERQESWKAKLLSIGGA